MMMINRNAETVGENGGRLGLARLAAAAAVTGSMLAAAAAPAPRAARIEKHRPTAGQPVGALFFNLDSVDNGLYTLSMIDGAAMHIGLSGGTGSNVGLAPSEDDTVLFGSRPSRLLRIHADGTLFTEFGNSIPEQGLAYDAEAGILYGANGFTFRTVNQVDGSEEMQLMPPPFGVFVQGIAFGGGGVYALALTSSRLFFYDPGSDSWSDLGDTGVLSWDGAGLAYNAREDRLYAKRNKDSSLYRIDPATAATEMVGDTTLDPGGGLAWIDVCTCPCPGDSNGDGVLDTADLTLLLEAWGPCPSAGVRGPSTGTLWGISSSNPARLYTLDAETGTATLVVGLDGGARFSGLSVLAGVVFGSDLFGFPGESGTFDTGSIDVDDGTITFVSDQDLSFDWHGLASNEGAGLLYAIDQGVALFPLKSLTASGMVGTIGAGTGIDGRGMAFDDGAGVLYATNSATDFLHTVDVTTGTLTTGLPLTVAVTAQHGLAFDEITRTLYLNVASTGLYSVDTVTGAATFIGANNVNGIDGLAWKEPPVGACCLVTGECAADVNELTCAASGGVYQGDGSDCAVVECPSACAFCSCPSDSNRDGEVDIGDLTALLANWGACPE